MKEKILWIGVVAIVLSWIGNYLYFQSKQLDHPIFLEHYYETYLEDKESTLTFYYLTNKKENVEVIDVIIDGVTVFPSSDGFFMWDSDTPQYVQEFSHHYLKSVRLELPKPIEEGSWTFEEITATFSNGQTVTADIGKVKVEEKMPYTNALESRFSSSNNQSSHEEQLVASQPLTIDSISLPFSQDISEDILVKINRNQEELKKREAKINNPDWLEEEPNMEWKDKDGVSILEGIFPFSLEKGERLGISMQLNPDRKRYFSLGVEISGTTEDGETYKRKAFIMDDPYLTQQAVDEIIAEEMEGKR